MLSGLETHHQIDTSQAHLFELGLHSDIQQKFVVMAPYHDPTATSPQREGDGAHNPSIRVFKCKAWSA